MLVGDGPACQHLERTLPSSTIFTGLLHGDAPARAYRNADLFVFPGPAPLLAGGPPRRTPRTDPGPGRP